METLLKLLPHEAENLKRQRDTDEILRVAQSLAEIDGITYDSPDVWLAEQCPEYDNSPLKARGLRLALDAAIAIREGK